MFFLYIIALVKVVLFYEIVFQRTIYFNIEDFFHLSLELFCIFLYEEDKKTRLRATYIFLQTMHAYDTRNDVTWLAEKNFIIPKILSFSTYTLN